MIRQLALTLAFVMLAGAAEAQSRTGGASLTIERPLTVSTVRPLTFGPSQVDGTIQAKRVSTQAIIRVTGDPGRIYRIRLPSSVTAPSAGAVIEGFTIWSDNSGDISEVLTARMDDTGRDRLHIGGQLRNSGSLTLSEVTTAVPLSVDYE